MKPPRNYISPLLPKEQQALYSWYTFSAWTLITCITILFSITLYQYIHIIKLKKNSSNEQRELQTIQHQVQQSEKTYNEQKIVHQRTEKIQAIYNHHFNPRLYIEELAKQTPSNACLTEVSCSKHKTITLQGCSSTVESVIAYLQSLQQSNHFEHFEITSLFPTHSNNTMQWFQFAMKGTLKTS